MPLTDRQRVELAIPARLMFRVLSGGAYEVVDEHGETVAGASPDDQVGALVDLVGAACREPLEDLPPAARAKLARRIEREVAFAREWTGQLASKWAIAVLYFIQEITEREILSLVAGSTLDQAIERFIPMIEDDLNVEAIDESARKQARHMLRDFQAKGFYV